MGNNVNLYINYYIMKIKISEQVLSYCTYIEHLAYFILIIIIKDIFDIRIYS